jgi:hypothetical protein
MQHSLQYCPSEELMLIKVVVHCSVVLFCTEERRRNLSRYEPVSLPSSNQLPPKHKLKSYVFHVPSWLKLKYFWFVPQVGRDSSPASLEYNSRALVPAYFFRFYNWLRSKSIPGDVTYAQRSRYKGYGSDPCKFNLFCVSNSHDSHGIRRGRDVGCSLEILQWAEEVWEWGWYVREYKEDCLKILTPFCRAFDWTRANCEQFNFASSDEMERLVSSCVLVLRTRLRCRWTVSPFIMDSFSRPHNHKKDYSFVYWIAQSE